MTNRLRLDPTDADPLRPEDTDAQPVPPPLNPGLLGWEYGPDPAARSARGCMVAIVAGTVAWVLLLLLVRAAFFAVVVAPSAAAATPLAQSHVSDDKLRPLAVPQTSTPGASKAASSAVPTAFPTAKPVRAKPTVRPAVPRSAGPTLVAGWATYWPAQGGAASKWLAAALGGGRRYLGRSVTVCSGSRCVRVRLTTSCACGDRHGEHTVLDLPEWAFARLASLGRGVIHVEVSR